MGEFRNSKSKTNSSLFLNLFPIILVFMIPSFKFASSLCLKNRNSLLLSRIGTVGLSRQHRAANHYHTSNIFLRWRSKTQNEAEHIMSTNTEESAITTTTSISAVATTTTTDEARQIKKAATKEKKAKARAKRQKLMVGLAKNVDRGLSHITAYQPFDADTGKFVAKSGLPDRSRRFIVLGIESSCDDTGAAVVDSYGNILGEALEKQIEIHEKWGGVVPGLAKEAHEKAIDSVVLDALKNANLTSIEQVDAIGVTVGPGLEICLRVGCTKAKELAIKYNKPFVGVHHLEAHILMARLPANIIQVKSSSGTTEMTTGQHQDYNLVSIGEGKKNHDVRYQQNQQHLSGSVTDDIVHESIRSVEFPFLTLLVSGGHCQLMRVSGIGNYTIIGGTLDDSLGEAYDKTARLLGLPVGGGGGPALEELAKSGEINSVPLPIPMARRKNCDFSYAGLKTAVRCASEKIVIERNKSNGADIIQSVEDLPFQDKANIAASFQNVAIKHLEQRLKRTMDIIESEERMNDLNNDVDIDKEGIEGNTMSLPSTSKNKKIRTLALVGGVAANKEIRSRIGNICGNREDPWSMIVPPPRLCTDQGTMSAWAAIERLVVGSSDDPHNQEVHARFPFSVKKEVS